MIRDRNNSETVEELVERFRSIAVAQYEAQQRDQIAQYNTLYRQMEAVRNQLKSRPGDQRIVLLPLLDSKNIHVRLKAAISLLGIAYDPARKALESVRDSEIFPQAADAGMMLRGLDDGSFVPS